MVGRGGLRRRGTGPVWEDDDCPRGTNGDVGVGPLTWGKQPQNWKLERYVTKSTVPLSTLGLVYGAKRTQRVKPPNTDYLVTSSLGPRRGLSKGSFEGLGMSPARRTRPGRVLCHSDPHLCLRWSTSIEEGTREDRSRPPIRPRPDDDLDTDRDSLLRKGLDEKIFCQV